VSELDGVADHYERLLAAHGATARGADYRDEASQRVRFGRLDRLVLGAGSVCDLGCGYGAYLDHLQAQGWAGDYVGIDLTPGMVDAARARHPGARFEVGSDPVPAEVVVASGIFNVRYGDDEAWSALVRRTIDAMWAACTLGVAFNVLSRAVSPHLFSVPADVLATWLPPGAVVEEDVASGELTAFAHR
jgi:SAM-dependent methyltransferase